MAKKKEKTLEEKLQEALVPENQWPYILPENWCWTRLENVANWGSGGTPSRKHPEYYQGNIPWIKTGELKDDFIYDAEEHISEEAISKSNAKLFPVNTVVLAMYGATIGKAGIMGCELATNQACACGVSNESINYRFLFEYIKSQKDGFIASGKGGAQPNISQQIIKSYPIPLPPLPEQKRIVYRIESLFAKLDEAKEKIQQVLDGAEMRKAAILHKAFTGELTKTWRRENNITTTDDVNREKLSKECEEYEIPYEIPDEWRWVTFNEVCTFIGSGVTPKGGQAVYTDSGIPFIRSQNVLNGKLDLSDVAYISDEINEKMKRTQIIGGETLLNITGASIGRSCYVPQEQSVGNVNQHVCILRFKNYINGYIPQLWLNSPKMQEFINFNQVGQTRQALNFKQIRGIYFPLPPLQEQLEMVRIIKYEINKLDVVCNSLANLAVRIDTMKKSILAKAFRGELGTNNPNEDSAINLLKEVLQDKF